MPSPRFHRVGGIRQGLRFHQLGALANSVDKRHELGNQYMSYSLPGHSGLAYDLKLHNHYLLWSTLV